MRGSYKEWPLRLISPNVLAIVGVAYRGPERIRALTVYGVVVGFAGLSAQLIGGVLINSNLADLGWRSVFLINLPVGVAAVVLAPRLVPESRADRATRLDVVGTVLIIAGLAALLVPLVEGRQQVWPTWTWLCLAVAPLVLLGFAGYEVHLSRRGGVPMLPQV